MPGTPPGQQRDIASKDSLPPRISSLDFTICAAAQGCRIGFLVSATGGRILLPHLGEMRLPQNGCAGSLVTGLNFSPGTGKNSTPSEAQPMSCEEKSGTPEGRRGAAVSAAKAIRAAANAVRAARAQLARKADDVVIVSLPLLSGRGCERHWPHAPG